MAKIMGFALHLLIGYLLGAWLSGVSMSTDLSQTDWSNLWVYAWMFFWPIFLLLKFLYYGLIVLGVILLGGFLYTRIFDR